MNLRDRLERLEAVAAADDSPVIVKVRWMRPGENAESLPAPRLPPGRRMILQWVDSDTQPVDAPA